MSNPISQFIQHYSRGFNIDNKSIDELSRHFHIVTHPKNYQLFREQQKHDNAYYILQGAARSYYLKDGVEVSTWFAFEQDVVGSLYAYKDLPSRETVELLEDATLISINLRSLAPFAYSSLAISNFVRSIIEEYAQFLEDRIFFMQFMSAAERYELLLKHEPQALQRVPLTYISSYLGMSRETLSRLRGK